MHVTPKSNEEQQGAVKNSEEQRRPATSSKDQQTARSNEKQRGAAKSSKEQSCCGNALARFVLCCGAVVQLLLVL